MRRELEATFLDADRETGLERYGSLRARFPDVVDERLTNGLGYFLLRENRTYAAIEIFESNARNYPNSANVWDSLGEAYLNAAEYTRAMTSYRRSLDLDAENENAENHIEWIREALVALRNPVDVPTERLSRYAGDYGPRQVTLCGTTLYYQRAGRARHRLIPMSDDTFMLSGLGTFRLRFITGDPGPAARIIGFYADGSRDESVREAQRSTVNCTETP